MSPPAATGATLTEVLAGGTRWKLLDTGGDSRECALLLHGAGSSSHSWQRLLPWLLPRYRVLAPDLPGHAGTAAISLGEDGMRAMADAVVALLRVRGATPTVLLGHSAGAALAARLTIDGRVRPRRLVSVNGAFFAWRGFAGSTFAPLASALASLPALTALVAKRARSPGSIRHLIASTGSALDAAGVAEYERLFRDPGHVAGTLAMMAHWNLAALERDLPRLALPLLLIAGTNDRAVPPAHAGRVQALVPGSAVAQLTGLGHLAHEEDPARVARLLEDYLAEPSR
ncbi:MAG: alpha/beta fold hydrolase [Proteobacteria bacterium]|nr:alpha/beta fold hydrolase [Pseudomonadota bacterium]